MGIHKINIEEFLSLAKHHPVLDVRSPGEYLQAHIPGAHNLPLFTDEERKNVGTAYKQQSRQTAIKMGLDYFGVKMRYMVESAESIWAGIPTAENNTILPTDVSSNKENQSGKTLLLHCWRGGMRSAAMAWLLDLYGFKIFTLNGGYKTYRRWILFQFEKEYKLNIIGGYTGSGKTPVLDQLAQEGYPVINLERLARHKGSAFGALGEKVQPSQEMFENLLGETLFKESNETKPGRLIPANPLASPSLFIEDESQRIGLVNVPISFWKQMRNAPVYFLDIPFEERLNYISEEYGKFDREPLIDAITRIQKRLGGLEAKTAINYLLENNVKESFRILLRYYDKYYLKGLHNRENLDWKLNKIPCLNVDTKSNTQKLVSCALKPVLQS
jgi:tRNA 2-selenouridine synthase